MSKKTLRIATAVVAVLVAAAVAISVTAFLGSDDGSSGEGQGSAGAVLKPEGEPDPGVPERHTGPQGLVGQFVVHCAYSHSAPDDPIVFWDNPGLSHRHDFYGATDVDASSTPAELLAGDTTCDKTPDTAAYWQPTLYDGDEIVEPLDIAAYYRAAPGVDPADVQTMPVGLAMIAGDHTATEPQPGDAAVWTCGSRRTTSDDPPDCPSSAPLTMVLTFQDCWDGEYLDSDRHQSHVAYSAGGECPEGFDVHIPQITMSIRFPIHGADHDLRLASGSTYSAHGDFWNAWDPEGLQREIDACIKRDVVCDLASNRAENPLFSG